MDRKKQILAALLVVWVLIILFRVVAQEEPKRVPLKYVKGQTVSKDKILPRTSSATTVQLDRLKDRPVITLNNPKNIFAPIQAHLPPPPPPPPLPQPPPPPPPPTPEELAQ
jgi:hypothetical protein